MLDSVDVTEQDCQDFIEQNTELFYTPFLLNHHIHLGCILSKFPLDTSLITDFVYITKSSDCWQIVLVELEHPNKKIFRDNQKNIVPTAKMSEALSQVASWRDFIYANRDEVIRRLEPLLCSMKSNPISFKYLLVIGRGEQKSENQKMRARLSNLCQEDSIICTYDSLISYYQSYPKSKTNVLKLSKDYFTVKYLHREETPLFSYLLPEHLEITTDQKNSLINLGYDIEEWEKGKYLSYNNKITMEKWQQQIKDGSFC